MTQPQDLPEAWNRPAYASGGGDPFLLYVVYAVGRVAEELALSRSRHRTSGLPDGLHFVVRGRDHAEFTPADFALFGDEGAFRDADSASMQFVIAGSVPDPADLGYLRDVVGVIAALLDAGGCVVFDVQTLRLFTAEEFRREVFEPDAPRRDAHLVFMSSDDEATPGSIWLHTRGLRKFGRPDVSIRGLDPSAADVGADVMHRFAELGVRGGLVPEGTPIAVAGFPEGFTCHHGGSNEDHDFNNVHLAIRRGA